MADPTTLPADSLLHSLYSDHHPWLHGWLRRKLGCTHHAADLAQDTFVRLLDKQRELEQLREPRAYLTTIAHGLVVNHWRRRALEQAYQEAVAALPLALAPSPEEQYGILQTLQEIDAMLHGLPERTRRIFLLSQMDGLPYADIARQLDISLNVVQKAMVKAFSSCYAILFE